MSKRLETAGLLSAQSSSGSYGVASSGAAELENINVKLTKALIHQRDVLGSGFAAEYSSAKAKQASRRNLTLDVVLPQQLPIRSAFNHAGSGLLAGLIENFTRKLYLLGAILGASPAGDQLKLQLLPQLQPRRKRCTAEQPGFRTQPEKSLTNAVDAFQI